jgi:hypothetical protein
MAPGFPGQKILRNICGNTYVMKKTFLIVVLFALAAAPVFAQKTTLPDSTAQLLRTATVKRRLPLIEQRTDRTIVNVDALLSAAGSNALEALSKSPGVIVDASDNISLNGKSNVLVLVDGRPAYMSGQDLAAYLRSLPAGMLDKFELIPNPPAEYDAAGNAVINIVLKKLHTAGFNGGVNAGYNQGVYARSNEAVNFNYHRGRTNLFGNASYSLDQNYSDQTYSRSFSNPASSIQQNSGYHYRVDGWNGRVGMDLSPNAQTTLGFMVNGGTRPKMDVLTYANVEYDASGAVDSSGLGSTTSRYGWRNIAVNANAAHTFKGSKSSKSSQGSKDSKAKVTADLDYVRFHAENSQHAPVSVSLPDGSVSSSADRVFRYPGDTYIYSARADLIWPLAAGVELDAGLKFSSVTTDNRLDWLNVDAGKLTPDYSKSNDFRYRENIGAAYLNYKKQWGRWGIQAGLRAENTIAAGHQFPNPVVRDSSFQSAYTNLFPSVFVSYKLDTGGNQTLVMSYTQRIRRPGYQQLNPFVFYLDQYTYSAGNPSLQPYRTHFIELKYAYKQHFGVSAGFGYGANEAQNLTQVYGEVLITRPQNYILSRSWSVVPFVVLRPARWWDLHFNAVLIFLRNTGTAPGVTVDQRTNVHEFETSNAFRLSDSWSAELDGFFPGKQAFGQTQSERAVVNISGGIRKNILHGQGTINLTFNDLFHTFYRTEVATIDIAGVSARSTGERDTRRIGMAFSYHFGKTANARKSHHDNGGAEDEQFRTK